jgi:hypothetical protein
MIFFWGSGRFGNQLFQYAFLQSVRRNNEIILATGFDELKSCFVKTGIINIKCTSRLARFCLNGLFRRFIIFLSSSGIISRILAEQESLFDGLYKRESGRAHYKKGIFKRLLYADGMFQSECFFNPEKISSLAIRGAYIKEAKHFLSTGGGGRMKKSLSIYVAVITKRIGF